MDIHMETDYFRGFRGFFWSLSREIWRFHLIWTFDLSFSSEVAYSTSMAYSRLQHKAVTDKMANGSEDVNKAAISMMQMWKKKTTAHADRKEDAQQKWLTQTSLARVTGINTTMGMDAQPNSLMHIARPFLVVCCATLHPGPSVRWLVDPLFGRGSKGADDLCLHA